MNYEREFSIAGELEEEVVNVARAVTFTFVRNVVYATPEDTGRAQGNWFVGINRPIRQTKPNRRAGQATSEGQQKIFNSKAKWPDYWVSNNLPYIERLNDGYSDQAPAKFVETAFNIAKRVAE